MDWVLNDWNDNYQGQIFILPLWNQTFKTTLNVLTAVCYYKFVRFSKKEKSKGFVITEA